jgi:hypothetical protein
MFQLSLGGVYNDYATELVQEVTDLIPLGRMAAIDEYQGAVISYARMRRPI